jgi:hypothetical protein
MRRRRAPNPLAVLAAALAAVLATAAIFEQLRGLLHRGRATRGEAALDERERLRRALAPITVQMDMDKWYETFGKLPDDFDWEAFKRTLPPDLDLSGAIIEEREEERRELGLN